MHWCQQLNDPTHNRFFPCSLPTYDGVSMIISGRSVRLWCPGGVPCSPAPLPAPVWLPPASSACGPPGETGAAAPSPAVAAPSTGSGSSWWGRGGGRAGLWTRPGAREGRLRAGPAARPSVPVLPLLSSVVLTSSCGPALLTRPRPTLEITAGASAGSRLAGLSTSVLTLSPDLSSLCLVRAGGPADNWEPAVSQVSSTIAIISPS